MTIEEFSMKLVNLGWYPRQLDAIKAIDKAIKRYNIKLNRRGMIHPQDVAGLFEVLK